MTVAGSELNPTIHPLPRLSICAALAAGPEWVEFGVVRDTTGLSDSTISKHSRALEDAGVLEVRKGAIGRRPRTWLRLTTGGRRSFQSHVEALKQLVAEQHDPLVDKKERT